MKLALSFFASTVSVAVAAALHHVMWASRERQEREGRKSRERNTLFSLCVSTYVRMLQACVGKAAAEAPLDIGQMRRFVYGSWEMLLAPVRTNAAIRIIRHSSTISVSTNPRSCIFSGGENNQHVVCIFLKAKVDRATFFPYFLKARPKKRIRTFFPSFPSTFFLAAWRAAVEEEKEKKYPSFFLHKGRRRSALQKVMGSSLGRSVGCRSILLQFTNSIGAFPTIKGEKPLFAEIL